MKEKWIVMRRRNGVEKPIFETENRVDAHEFCIVRDWRIEDEHWQEWELYMLRKEYDDGNTGGISK